MGITGNMYRSMALSGAALLNDKKEEANNLNVFPVPDGDTGINMSLTMSTVGSVAEDLPVGECAEKVAALMLRSARGNSGAILSLFYRGMAKALKDCEEADSADIALAFQKGTEEAYKAVMNPTEGTILTVMRKCAEEAVEVTKTRFKGDVLGFFVYIMQTAQKTLDETPEMLPVLKEANVVDAGGSGFVVMLSGMLAALKNKPILPLKKASKSSSKNDKKKSADFKEFNTEDIRFAYCTECIVDKDKAHRGEGKGEKLGEFVRSIGDSVVFVDTDDLIKLHVHTNNPGQVLEQAIRFGSLLTVKIENM
jgi:DAK2 domain fusion protein YloV